MATYKSVIMLLMNEFAETRIPIATGAVNGVAKGTLGLLCFICTAIVSLRVTLRDY